MEEVAVAAERSRFVVHSVREEGGVLFIWLGYKKKNYIDFNQDH
jgi:hypothetical protein